MRHRIDRRKLNRQGAHLRSMLANLSIALIDKESIKTTLPRARELRRYIEPLVTLARLKTLASKRLLSSKLHQHRSSVHKMIDEIAVRFAERPGGYVRIVKAGTRSGDNSDMAIIQFVDYFDVLKKREEAEAEAAGKGQKKSSKKEAAETQDESSEATS